MLLLGLNHPLLITPSVYPTNALRVEAINHLCIEISNFAHAMWMIQSINDTMLADKIQEPISLHYVSSLIFCWRPNRKKPSISTEEAFGWLSSSSL